MWSPILSFSGSWRDRHGDINVKEINHGFSEKTCLNMVEGFNFLLCSWDIVTKNQNQLLVQFCNIPIAHIQRQRAAGLHFPSFPCNEIPNLDISFHTYFVSLQVMWLVLTTRLYP